jgi:hypothetical protein
MIDPTIQLALSIGVPTLAVLIGILINNSRLNDVNNRISDQSGRINDLRSHMDARFDDMRDMWRGELRRVEEVIDARLRHLEER